MRWTAKPGRFVAPAIIASLVLGAADPVRAVDFKDLKFRVIWDNRPVAGVSKVSALKRTTEVVEHRSGGDPSTSLKSPGRTKYEPITLERGVTNDTAFEDWANKVSEYGAAPASLASVRKDVSLELLNETGQIVMVYVLYRCWPSKYEALSDLDADHSGAPRQRLTLECEGWARETTVRAQVVH